jgi:hypothetical protein
MILINFGSIKSKLFEKENLIAQIN